ncbi:MFS transporter [Micromonospora sp. NPDC050397]|uniref:MFS transporter n=1 Tax=Micromonospora sp. NPDC050397 TaxID=3364279 RepID=UPI0038509E47
MADPVAAPDRRFRPRLSLAPLRSRGYRLLLVAEATSVFGDAFHAVALPWLVYQLGAGAGQLGLILGGYGLCRLAATPLAGVLIDRVGAWRVMLISDLGRTALTAGVAVAALSGTRDLLVVGVLVAGVGLGAGLFEPAAYAITPSLLPADQLQAGNALHTTATFAAGLAGPGIAGLLVASISPGAAFAVDAVTFAVSACCLALIGVHQRAAPPVIHPERAPGATRWTLVQLLRGSPLLRTVLLVTAVANLTVGGMVRVGLPSLASTELSAGAGGFGGLLAAFTSGSLAGGLLAAGMTGLARRGRAAMISGLVLAAAVTVVPFAGYPGAVVALVVAGISSTVTNVLVITMVQQATPHALLGRVMSAVLFAALGLFPVSVVVAGALVSQYGSQVLFLTTGASLCAAFVFGLSRRAMRQR